MDTESQERSPQAVIKRELLVMVAIIVVLDAVAITAFYLLHLNRGGGTPQEAFVGVWTVVSFLVVAVQLRKIRRARLEIVRGGRTPNRQ